ncbi:MAG: 50S ribosomal protein L4 [Bdellovibrionales bacterium RIFOXYD1_FULL_44_7]|nr:MAG: 50S ribosomal protein L4 [Bdellovibrionales bacterium RIFOXYD1_FULL_44_7]
MPTLDVFSQEKQKVGNIELRDDVFGVSVNRPLVHQVLKAQLAGRRQGTAKTKTKAEVRGGGRKPFRQKGTGNARQGSSRSPLNPGGGQTFGPIPRSYVQSTPKEMVRGALRSALSDRVNAKRMLIIDQFKLASPKTKGFSELLRKKLQLEKKVLIVDDANKNLELSGRNIPNLQIIRSEGINVYDIIRNDWLVCTKEAAQKIEKHLAPLGMAPEKANKKATKKAGGVKHA